MLFPCITNTAGDTVKILIIFVEFKQHTGLLALRSNSTYTGGVLLA